MQQCLEPIDVDFDVAFDDGDTATYHCYLQVLIYRLER